MKRRVSSERGQILAIMAIAVVSMVALGAVVMDVGVWFRGHRATQAVADASALAGAQALPYDTGQASSLALQYSSSNGGGVSSPDVTYSTNTFPDDTIAVSARRTSEGFLSRIFGISTVNLKADAQARAFNIGQAQYTAPFAVDRRHPLLSGPSCPCFSQGTMLDLKKSGPGAFRIINLDGSYGGTGQQILSDWILKGYDGLMPLGWYWNDDGAKFNSSEVLSALDQRMDHDLLLPVYDKTQGQGSTFQYEVVGWVGFHLTGYNANGANSKLFGYFTHVVWKGIESESSQNFFGATIVKLVS